MTETIIYILMVFVITLFCLSMVFVYNIDTKANPPSNIPSRSVTIQNQDVPTDYIATTAYNLSRVYARQYRHNNSDGFVYSNNEINDACVVMSKQLQLLYFGRVLACLYENNIITEENSYLVDKIRQSIFSNITDSKQ